MSIRVLASKIRSNEVSNPTVTVAPAAGERILVLGALYFFTGAIFDVDDDQGTVYTRVDTNADGFGSFTKARQYLSDPYAGGASCNVRLFNDGAPSNHYYTWMVLGLSGLDPSPVDSAARGTNSGNTSGVDGNVVSAAALAQAANHVVGVFSSGQGASSISLTQPAGYTSRLIEEDGTTYMSGAVCDKQTSAIETPNLQWSYTDNASGWTACVVPYKIAANAIPSGVRRGRLNSKVRGG